MFESASLPNRRVIAEPGQVAAVRSSTSSLAQRSSLAERRKPRHSGLFEAVARLDASIDAAARRELADWIRDQYAQDYPEVPLGFVARCYLGPPFVDHRLSLMQSIVEHYQPADSVPHPFGGARMMARLGSYEFVEVYSNGTFIPVRTDGTVDVSPGGSHG